MSRAPDVITPSLLRSWPLPSGADSKYGRGRVLVVGGSAKTPGGAMLAGIAALRVGAGHLTLGVAETVAPHLAVALPEAGVIGLAETATGAVRGDAAGSLQDDLASADVVLVGPGLDDAEQTAGLLRSLSSHLDEQAVVVLDAYALGVLPDVKDLLPLTDRRPILTPNRTEAERLLGREIDDLTDDVREIAGSYGAIVVCRGVVAGPDGQAWQVATGHGGLATAGSGDVLAGAVAGLAARGGDLSQAACWATHVHAGAGDRLAARVGPLGFLARELLAEMPAVLVELSA